MMPKRLLHLEAPKKSPNPTGRVWSLRRSFGAWRPLAPFAGLGGAILLVVLLAMPGCPAKPPPAPETPLKETGVPVIRVLVASGETIRLSTTGPYRILADGHEVAGSMDPLPEGMLTRQGVLWSLHAATFSAENLTVESRLQTRRVASEGLDVGRSCVRIGSTSYRGRVVFTRDAEAGILAVNHVDLESYLAGVLPRELYAGWHDRTYQALAIAARTYALYEKAAAGGRRYDLRDDQSSQVYGGFSAETQKSWRAVRATHGIVLAAGTKGNEKIFKAHYSACCGGIVNSVYVLYGPPVSDGPLVGGQVCVDCKASGRYRWAPVTVPKAVIHRALGKAYRAVAELDAVKTIQVVEKSGARPVWINVVGSNGRKVRIRAEDLRLALLRDGDPSVRGLYSMNCRIRDAGGAIVFDRGRGFGHGVGMCQWGAEGKAKRGATVQEILSAYYPGAKLFKAY